MRFEIPALVRRARGQSSPHRVTPLFIPDLEASHTRLSAALQKLGTALWKHFADLVRDEEYEEIVEASFSPPLAQHRVQVEVDLRDRILRGTVLLLTFPAFERRVTFSPSLPDVWFTVERGEDIGARATAVFREYFLNEKREGEDLPEKIGEDDRVWLEYLDVEVAIEPGAEKRQKKEGPTRAELGSSLDTDGERELHHVGRRLDTTGTAGVTRALFRDRESRELLRCVRERRPVLLTGPSGTGKTAIVLECVNSLVEAQAAAKAAKEERKGDDEDHVDGNGGTKARKKGRRKPSGDPEEKRDEKYGGTWLLAPGRLISGMSYVGQWENRLLSILEAASRHGHVLFFDDILGLFRAGRSAQSDLTIGHVLEPWLAKRKIAVIGEITPEALRILRENHRSFADQFHLIPLSEPSEDEARRILVHLCRDMEDEYGCRFAPGALLAVERTARRWVKHRASPGKSAGLLRQIAVKKAGQPIEANDVIEEFQKTSGLTTPFADDRGSFERDDLVASLHRRVIGQDQAVAAVADAVSVARSNLADPARPFASLLFLGPTGAGKTELAKSLARVLFNSEEKLIRFDLNEFSTSDAAARLSGSIDQPEGLLSSAIRREPWCVLLLDEIEKAHPRVFDVLLQALDDARLTDALGQTASFQNVFIVMTSNLGARDAASGVGFDSSSRERTAVFLEAAEKFFRPEFMGRLDRVVTFHPLSRENLSKVARLLLNEILSREGFRRNHAVLDLHPRGLERLVDEGRHPQLGARALKRALERHLVHPVAVHLSGRSREGVSVVRMDAPDGKFETSVVDLVEAGPVPSPFVSLDTSDPLAFLGRVDAFLDRLRMSVRNLSTQQDLSTRRIEAGAWALEGCSALSDRVSLLREELDTNSLIVSAAAVSSLLRSAPRPSSDDYGNMKASLLRQLCAVRDAAAHLQDVAAATRRPRSKISSLLEEMAVDALRLETQVEEVLTSEVPPRALLLTRTIGSQILHFWDLLGVSPAQLKSLDGPSGWTYTLCEGSWNVQEALWRTGTSLVWLPDGSIVPVEVRLLPLSPGDNEEVAAKKFAETRGIDPAGSLGPVNLVFSFKEGRGTALDVRTKEAFPIEVMSEDTEYTLMPASDGLLEYKKLSAAHAALPREFLEEPA